MQNFPAPSYPQAEPKLDFSDYNSTIFVSIASYRDPEINKTLESMYSKAHFPDLLHVAVHFQESEEVRVFARQHVAKVGIFLYSSHR